MKLFKRGLGFIFAVIGVFFIFPMLGALISGELLSALGLFIVSMLFFFPTIFLFDLHHQMLADIERQKVLDNKSKISDSPYAKFNKKADKINKESTQANRSDLATLWEMGTSALEDDKIDLSEARLLFAYMKATPKLDKDNRTRYLFTALKEALADKQLDAIEALEIKTLLSEFVDTSTKIKEIEVSSKPNPKKKNNTPKPRPKRVKISNHASSHYSFNYIDAHGDFSSRELSFISAKVENGYAYLIGICLERNARRTFRADRIYGLVDLETGELIDDAESYVRSLC